MKRCIAAVSALILTGAAYAAQPAGPYIGALAGQTDFDVDSLDYSTDSFTWGAFAGWQFGQNIGVEAGYYRPKTVSEPLGGGTLEVSTEMLAASLIGTLPLGDTWSLFGRAGMARAKLTARGVVSGSPVASASDSSTDPIFGGGIGAMFDGALLRLEYSYLSADDVDASIISLGIVWFLPWGR